MMYEDKIKAVDAQLSDFQKSTVDYLVKRMYDEGQNRMLVADEVGLGKTWIAKGVIAKAYERWCSESHEEKKHFNIYYICSNQQLSAQNLAKVNFTKDSRCVIRSINRISMLARRPEHEEVPVQIYSLTPDTSFSQRSAQGIKEERAIIYAILERTGAFNKIPLEALLKGSDNTIKWEPEVDKQWRLNILRGNIAEVYIDALKKKDVNSTIMPKTFKDYGLLGKMSLWEVIVAVVKVFDRKSAEYAIYDEIIGNLRKVMTDVCLKLMDADIFIMDEFQRYSQLIDTKGQSESDTIARKVFGQNQVKVLMLSATPFKAFTNQYDEELGEQHYRELKRVLKFLYEGTDMDWQAFEQARGKLYTLMLQLKDTADKKELLGEIETLKQKVEDVYSRVMVRTEKIIASNDPNAMIEEVEKKPLPVTKQEIADFVNLDTVFKAIYEKQGEHAPSPIDYAKSAPYAMSFLRDYKVGEKAQGKELRLQKNAFVDLNEINKYEFPKNGHWPHEKLRLLMKNMRREAKLLWCPPSLPYYPSEGAFRGQEKFTKTLIFSAWKLVPKMIATMVSYEAERQSLGQLPKEEGIKYFADKRVASQGDKARKPVRRLVFAKDKNSMTTLLLAYPCKTLAESVNPAEYIHSGLPLRKIIEQHSLGWKSKIADFCHSNGNEADHEGSHISWVFPMESDWKFDNGWMDKELGFIFRKAKETQLTSLYIPRMKDIVMNKQSQDVPKNPTERELQRQSLIMSTLAMGSPAICAYRALRRYYKTDNDALACAFRIGLAFIDLFNKPESIAVLELLYPQKSMEYWQKVISYSVEGNLQAVLDEYVFMLRNDYEDIYELTEALCSAVTLRTSTLKIDDASSFEKKDVEDSDVRHTMRSHFAAAFGVNAKSSQGSEIRATSIREAFNSPFRPFVLATTSIGQEGLDFHWYCRRIIHWNLPNNPIDFEQREGRINRYRGKVIRQRVAEKYRDEISKYDNPWEELFEIARQDKLRAKFPCDIVPNWHFDSDGVSIERVVPLYEFSQDIQRYEKMLHVLGLYRLTFGQPRQEELAEALDCALTPEEIDKLLIDLCPMRRERLNTNKNM